MEKSKKIWLIGIVCLLLIIAGFLIFKFYPEKESFSVKTFLIKLNIPLTQEAVTVVGIINNEDFEQSFNIYFNDFNGLVSLSETEFTLSSGEKKEIEVSFKDTKNQIEVYVGELIIETDTLTKKIPIILSVEAENPVFSIIQNSIPKYDNVYPGGKLGVEINVYDLGNIVSPSVKASYFIRNFDGDLIWSDEKNLVIGKSLTEVIAIPKNWEKGDYVFVTLIDYKETKSISGYLFTISDKKSTSFTGDFKLFVIIILVFFVGVLVLFFYFIKTRDDLLIQLKKQQSQELKRHLDVIKVSKKKISQIKKPALRKKKLVALKKIKKVIVKKIKKKQKAQVRHMKVLKKAKKKSTMKQKLGQWGREGFNLGVTQKAVNRVSKGHITKIAKDLKNKGYAMGFLKK